MTDITPELVLKAYAYGVFPMAKARGDDTVFWVQPKLRGVLPLDSFHVPRSLRKVLRRGDFRVTVDTAFDDVLEGCARPGPGRPETWINGKIVGLFRDLHQAVLDQQAIIDGTYDIRWLEDFVAKWVAGKT